MIQYIDLVVNTESMRKSKHNSITGEIFFQVGSELFPEENWSDFIVVVLGWWLNALKKFCESGDTLFEMVFMDGPLKIRSKLKTESVLELSFIKRYSDCEDVLFSTDCTIDNLKKCMLKAARKVLREIEDRQWETCDTVALKNLVYSFKTKSL